MVVVAAGHCGAQLMKILRPSLMIGAAYSLPVIVWSLATAANVIDAAKPVSPFILQSTMALICLQGLTVALIMPMVSVSSDYRTSLFSALLLLAVPLPVFTFAWLATSVSAAVIIKAQLLILGAAMVLIGAGRTLSLGKLGPEVRPYAVVGLQLTAGMLVWVFRDEGSRWLFS
jgi:hypothetical protein